MDRIGLLFQARVETGQHTAPRRPLAVREWGLRAHPLACGSGHQATADRGGRSKPNSISVHAVDPWLPNPNPPLWSLLRFQIKDDVDAPLI